MYIWRAPGLPIANDQAPKVSRLLSYPFVLEQALVYLDLVDIGALISVGSPALSTSIRRLCTVATIGNFPDASIAPFPTPKFTSVSRLITSLSPFPKLTRIEIIAPHSCPLPTNGLVLLQSMPETLQHLTLWFDLAGEALPDFYNSLSTKFPLLETLRLNITPLRAGELQYLHREPEFFDSLPPTLRWLSLISCFSPTTEQILQICQPLEPKVDDSAASDASSSPPVPHPKADDGPDSWGFKLPNLRVFEFSGARTYSERSPVTPDARKFPPHLHTYINHGHDYFLVNPNSLPSVPPKVNDDIARSMIPVWSHPIGTDPKTGRGWAARPQSALRTIVLPNNIVPGNSLPTDAPWYEYLPRTITSAHISWMREVEHERFYDNFPFLTSFGNRQRVTAVSLPKSLTKLNYYASPAEKSNAGPFLPELKHIANFVPARAGKPEFLPSNLLSFHMTPGGGSARISKYLLPHLPPTLTSLLLEVSDFPFQLLGRLPRTLTHLRIRADSMVLGEWVKDQDWTLQHVDYDLSQLPPNLQILHLHCPPALIRLPAAQLANLPRSLTQCVLPSVLLPPETPPGEHNTGGIFASVSRMLMSFYNGSPVSHVSKEAIEDVISMIPPGCWISTSFRVDGVADSKSLDQLVRSVLPRPLSAANVRYFATLCPI